MDKNTMILFLDIDGVLSIPDSYNFDDRYARWDGGSCWPIPMAFPFLRAIEADERFYPVWLSCWGMGSYEWTRKAWAYGHRRRWPNAYPLSKMDEEIALDKFPEYKGRHVDRKLLAVRLFMFLYPEQNAIWIEDGFSKDTREWAKTEAKIRLVDTMPMDGEIASFMIHKHEDLNVAVDTFIEFLLGKGALYADKTGS